jgi:cellulose biosynthesis protein BcsQ
MSNYSADQIIACRRVAMEQNQRLFEEANAINRSALDLLERSDFDSEMFLVYLQLKTRAKNRFREALEHATLLNEHFPSPKLQDTHRWEQSKVRAQELVNEP